MPELPFAELMQRLQEGDEETARLILERYLARLIRLAASRLPPVLAGKTDGESVVQSALKSFFKQQVAQPSRLSDWNHLWKLLARITINKCGHRLERYLAEKRDARREQRLDPKDDGSDPPAPAESGPSAEEALLFTETLEELFRRLTPFQAEVVRLRLENFTRAQIAEKLGCSDRKVYRALRKVRAILQEMGLSAAPSDEEV